MLKDEGITVSGRTIRRWCRAGRVPGSRRVNLVGKWAMPQSSLWHIKQLVSGDAK
jgi:predicted site-specific integrase-resolvase